MAIELTTSSKKLDCEVESGRTEFVLIPNQELKIKQGATILLSYTNSCRSKVILNVEIAHMIS